jgi:hypothetical protein
VLQARRSHAGGPPATMPQHGRGDDVVVARQQRYDMAPHALAAQDPMQQNKRLPRPLTQHLTIISPRLSQPDRLNPRALSLKAHNQAGTARTLPHLHTGSRCRAIAGPDAQRSSRAAQSSSRCWASACGRDAVVPSPLVVAKLKAACADPDGSCFGVSASIAAVDLRARRASANAAGRSCGASDRHHRDVADAVARRSRYRMTAISC